MTQIWFIAAAVLLLAELLVPTFFILPFAIGSFFAGLASLLTDNQNIQLSTFIILALLAFIYPLKFLGQEIKKKNQILALLKVQTNILV